MPAMRQHWRWIAALSCILLITTCGCKPDHILKQQIEQLKAFAAANEKISNPPVYFRSDVSNYFKIAKTGDLDEVRQAFWPAPSGFAQNPTFVESPSWWAVFETDGAYQLVSTMEAKYVQLGTSEIFRQVPRGSIYMGGSAQGSFLIDAFSKSRRDGDPFFSMSHNSITMDSYLEYLRLLYGSKVRLPTEDEANQIIDNYVADARKRLDHDVKFPQEPRQLLPGEAMGITNEPLQLAGTTAGMEAIGRFVIWMVDKNPERQLYVEMAFPIDCLMAHLEPRGLIFKVNREPLEKLSDEAIANDRKYWSEHISNFLGSWLTPETPVKTVVEFDEKIYVQKDFKNFKGDRKFVEDNAVNYWFSRLRYYSGSVYQWRSEHTTDETERSRMQNEADFAFQQAFAMSPKSLEAVLGYAYLLRKSNRTNDALMVISTGLKLNPSDAALKTLKNKLEQPKAK